MCTKTPRFSTNKCFQHLKDIKLKYQNIGLYVYQKAQLPLLLAVGIEPRPLEWE